MNRTRMAAWHVTLAMSVALSCGPAPAGTPGEVTVLGTSGVRQLAPAYGDAGAMGSSTPPSDVLQLPKPNLVAPETPLNSSWYTRFEYFHWGEPKDNVNEFHPTVESGALFTLGYVHRVESERYRVELFGGSMGHSGYATYSMEVPDPDVIGETTTEVYTSHVSANAAYFGGRAEYEYLWDVNFEQWLPMTFFVGIGTRAWNRSVYDRRTDGGLDLPSESNVWWTVYPYVGSEKRWNLGKDREIFASSRVGCTALTFTQFSNDVDPAFYPNPGLTAQVECGVRSQHMFLSGCFEVMSWQQSGPEHLHGDTSSQKYFWGGSQTCTSGLRLGFTY